MRTKPPVIRREGKTYLVMVVISAAYLGDMCLANGEGEGGFEYWTITGVSFDLQKNWTVRVDELLKLGDDATRFTYHHTDLGFIYHGFTDWLDLGLHYRHGFKRDRSTDWLEERRPHVDLTTKSRLGDIDLFDRSRIEYREKEAAPDMWRYTNKLTVKLPHEFTKWKLRPCIADQVYIDLNSGAFDRNKIYTGFSLEPSANTLGAILYVWDSDKTEGKWKNTNILWLQLKFYF